MIKPIVGLMALLSLVGAAILAFTGLHDGSPAQLYAAAGLFAASIWLFLAEAVLRLLTEIRDEIAGSNRKA